ncbi:MAG: L,D-transpeptidase family protein [Candidatus Omnitrophota bacterium]|nr:L,D-transpeptidase family protein [Candidatus Omnitrophota bacterium]
MKKKIFIIFGVLFLAGLVVSLVLFFVRSAGPSGKKNAVSESGLANQAKELLAKGRLLEAKAALQKLVMEYSNSSEVTRWQEELENINIKLLFSPQVIPGSAVYEVKPGDALSKIAKAYNTTAELIKKCNGLTGDTIVPGQKIKVWSAPFNILVDKSQNTLLLKANEEVIKTYTVSTGKNNCTPVGNFKITSKLPNPTWFKAGAVVSAESPENVLGTRWLGFDLAGYGIHGTTDPKSLGKQVTQGCVRMSNTDVEELYSIVPQGTEVTIVD